jgi:hypothetical protein
VSGATAATGGAGVYRTGETGLIVKVSEAESVVSRWRNQFDPAAAAGVPAHITVLYPFLHQHRVDAAALAELAMVFGMHQAFEVQLAQSRRFPGVLYLAPEPEAGLRALTRAIATRWPEAPPYGGQFADVIPHLTIAHSQEPQVLDAIEADVCGRLPVVARIAAVELIAYDGERWIQVRSFGLATRAEDRSLPGLAAVRFRAAGCFDSEPLAVSAIWPSSPGMQEPRVSAPPLTVSTPRYCVR